MWQILVPCQWNDGTPIRTRHHREWDKRVQRLTGGLTVYPAGRGRWRSDEGTDYFERVIPVGIVCPEEIMNQIADITIAHYEQEAVLFYRISDDARIRHATPRQRGRFIRDG
jgi:hypothetical protein